MTHKQMMEKEMFEEMIRDWQADNPEYSELEIARAEIDAETQKWSAAAQDDSTTYLLTDDGNGNVIINYLGTR